MQRKYLVVILILAVAMFFRFYKIDSTPPGLYPDEAMNGNNAIQAIETGDYKVFYQENNGREGLFINLQAVSLKIFGYKAWALRIVSAIAGVLTIWGLYLLTARLFNWQIAAISSYLMAIGFWHVMFSRIGFRAILAPLVLVWGFYFLWRGLSSGRLLNFAISAAVWGLGLYTYIAFRAMPFVIILVLLAYWQTIKKDFDHLKYRETKDAILKGMAMFIVIFIIVSLPIGYHFWMNPEDFLGRVGQISIFASENPLETLANNTVKTLGMFSFVGDYNWRHNFSGQPLLVWPIGAFFVVGFLRSWIKLFRRAKTHGHLSTVHVMLLSWFLVGLVPTIVSNEGLPHALRAIIVAPVVFIFAGEGLWWFIDKVGDWYKARDFHESKTLFGLYSQHKGLVGHENARSEYYMRRRSIKESSVIATTVLFILLGAITIAEYDKYFNKWANKNEVAYAFNQNYVEIAEKLNSMPINIKKYVLVNASGGLVNAVPMPAQTIMFMTDTYTREKQLAKRIFYLIPDDYIKGNYDKNGIVIPLED